jgi:PUA domain protein
MSGNRGVCLEHKIRKRRLLRQKEARALLKEAKVFLGDTLPEAVEQAELDDGIKLYFLDGLPSIIQVNDSMIPTLTCQCLDRLPSAVVDMGAVPYVCNGADVMAPGVVEIRGEFEEGGLIVVRDVRHGKALAISSALYSSQSMRSVRKGRVLKNLHYVGDQLWRAYS